MAANENKNEVFKSKPVFAVFSLMVLVGGGGFLFQVLGQHPERAWQSYLINFLLWSAVAQGALAFSMVTHLTKARWTKSLQGLSESFAAFFPISLVLFLALFLGTDHIFPWLHQDLHGKEVWLNLPFLFWRDFVGLLILYGLGLAYLFYALRFRRGQASREKRTGRVRTDRSPRSDVDPDGYKSKMTIISVFYIIAYAFVLSLLAFDLVMSMDPHWISTLFGAYSFMKAFYVGLGALIILANIIAIRHGGASGLSDSQFHDLGKLFFGFCLIWADFFYCQFVVIWYGNLSEETSYIIERTMTAPWNSLAWIVFAVVFIIPFLILLNRNVKKNPVIMLPLCFLVLIGIWLEHLLLLGPALNHDVSSLPLGLPDLLISLGFLGLMAMAVTSFLNFFPEIVFVNEEGAN